jgi:hypothetical protein
MAEEIYFVSFEIAKEITIEGQKLHAVSNSGSLLIKLEDPVKDYYDVHKQISDNLNCDIDRIHIIAFNKIS